MEPLNDSIFKEGMVPVGPAKQMIMDMVSKRLAPIGDKLFNPWTNQGTLKVMRMKANGKNPLKGFDDPFYGLEQMLTPEVMQQIRAQEQAEAVKYLEDVKSGAIKMRQGNNWKDWAKGAAKGAAFGGATGGLLGAGRGAVTGGGRGAASGSSQMRQEANPRSLLRGAPGLETAALAQAGISQRPNPGAVKPTQQRIQPVTNPLTKQPVMPRSQPGESTRIVPPVNVQAPANYAGMMRGLITYNRNKQPAPSAPQSDG